MPLDLFSGPGTLTQEMIDYIRPILTDTSENILTMFTVNFTGDLIDIPAGPLSFAVGYEHRNQSGFYRPDGLVVAGEGNGVPSLPTSGAFHVDEAYLELNIPILADAPLAERLEISAATRYSDYSTFGDDFTSKLGLRWQVNDALLIRGTYAEGFRAPSIGELFGSDSRFDATLTDPCSAPVAADLQANCAALGVPPGFTQPNPQISVTTGGNANLDAETADSYTAGFVWTPGFANRVAWSDRLDIEFTWYRHEVAVGVNNALDKDPPICLSCSLNGLDASTHDLPGRVWYVRASVEF